MGCGWVCGYSAFERKYVEVYADEIKYEPRTMDMNMANVSVVRVNTLIDGYLRANLSNALLPRQVKRMVYTYYLTTDEAHLFIRKEFQFASEEQIDLDLSGGLESTAVLMSPVSQGVYFQYAHDSNHNLLVDGFYRYVMGQRCYPPCLPPDMNRIIARYYVKAYSTRTLAEKMKRIGMHYPVCAPLLAL